MRRSGNLVNLATTLTLLAGGAVCGSKSWSALKEAKGIKESSPLAQRIDDLHYEINRAKLKQFIFNKPEYNVQLQTLAAEQRELLANPENIRIFNELNDCDNRFNHYQPLGIAFAFGAWLVLYRTMKKERLI